MAASNETAGVKRSREEKRIVISSDHAAVALKAELSEHLESKVCAWLAECEAHWWVGRASR